MTDQIAVVGGVDTHTDFHQTAVIDSIGRHLATAPFPTGSKVRVPEDTTLHDLRHFYASVLTKNGATPKQVQMKLGHAKPSITLNVCTHLREAEEDRTASMMEAALS
jgi:integrase